MTFLELCQETRLLCGGTGTGPSTVVAQTGESQRFVNWVIRAWEDIQNSQAQWHFLRTALSFTTTASQSYSPTDMNAPLLRVLDNDSLRIYLTSAGSTTEQFLYHCADWASFRDTYLFGPRATGQPTFFAIDPADKALHFNSVPGTGYTVTGTYMKKAVILAADADVPACPSQFHMAIVYRAILKYAGFEAAQEVKLEAAENYGPLMGALRIDQLPNITLDDPLA